MNIHLKEIKLNLNPCEVYEAFRYEIDLKKMKSYQSIPL